MTGSAALALSLGFLRFLMMQVWVACRLVPISISTIRPPPLSTHECTLPPASAIDPVMREFTSMSEMSGGTVALTRASGGRPSRAFSVSTVMLRLSMPARMSARTIRLSRFF